ncbi:MAG TPA: BON domain-containing protein [Candidatus Angelobacter sp.]|nr:BON domain-containing protein [Candidatus Angelobacter sp.]
MRVKTMMATLAALLLSAAIGCSSNKASTPDVKDQVAKALDNAGYKDVKVAVNNDKQLVTLTGDVKTQEDKNRAEELAKSMATGFVISDEIGVRPEGDESAAKKIDSNVDDAIEKDFKAVIIANRMEKQNIRFDAKNGVLTLKGDVDNARQREQVEKLAASVPNVQQVVNELDVKGAKRKPSGM